jgi:hypothetical protein
MFRKTLRLHDFSFGADINGTTVFADGGLMHSSPGL